MKRSVKITLFCVLAIFILLSVPLAIGGVRFYQKKERLEQLNALEEGNNARVKMFTKKYESELNDFSSHCTLEQLDFASLFCENAKLSADLSGKYLDRKDGKTKRVSGKRYGNGELISGIAKLEAIMDMIEKYEEAQDRNYHATIQLLEENDPLTDAFADIVDCINNVKYKFNIK